MMSRSVISFKSDFSKAIDEAQLETFKLRILLRMALDA